MPGFLDEIRSGGLDEIGSEELPAAPADRYRREVLPRYKNPQDVGLIGMLPLDVQRRIQSDPELWAEHLRYEKRRPGPTSVERVAAAGAMTAVAAPFLGPVLGALGRAAAPAVEAVKDIGMVARAAGPVAASQAAGPLIQRAGPIVAEAAMGEAAPVVGGPTDVAEAVTARAGARKEAVGSFLAEITNRNPLAPPKPRQFGFPKMEPEPGTLYHGTRAQFAEFGEDVQDPRALYGPGVYLTDDPSIAAGYARTKRSRAVTPSSSVLRVKPKGEQRLIDLDGPLPEDAVAHLKGGDEYVQDALEANPKTGAEFYRELKDVMANNGLTTSEAGEVLDSVSYGFRTLGYHGLTHTGGKISGGKPHKVTIIFDPKSADIVERVEPRLPTDIFLPGPKARPNERGSFYVPSPTELKESFQFAPKLKRYPSRDPALRLDEKYALIKNRSNAGAQSAEERARSLQSGLDPQGKWAVDRYLVLKDELARVRSGLSVTGGRTEAQLLTDIQNTTAQVPAGFDLGQREAAFRAWSDEVFDRLVNAGVLDPRSKRTDYVPHLVRRYYDEYADRIQGGGRGVGQLKPGQTKRAEGSELDIERDPFRAMAFADYLSRRAEADSLFRREVTNLYDKTARIRNGIERFDKGQHALYSFGGPGQAHLIAGVDAEDIVSAVTAQGRPRPGTVSYEITHNGRKYNILPRDLAEGLFDAGKKEELGPVGRLFAGAATLGRTTQLALNPQFQLAQIPADLATAFWNVPPWKWPKLAKSLAVHLGENIEDQLTVLAGRYSERLAKKREAGIVTEIWENLAAKGEPDHVVKDVTPAGAKERFMGIPGLRRMKEAPRFAYDVIIASGQVRESTIKGALADIYMKPGWVDKILSAVTGGRLGAKAATPERAAFWANRVMGKYIMTSGTGRQFHRHIQMTKWFLEQMLRMTVDAARDPATGKWSMQGLLSGPLPYIVAYKVLQEKLNNRSEATKKAAQQLPDYAKTGIVGKVHEDGSFDVWKPDTLATLAQGMIATAVTGAETAREFGPVAALSRTASDLGSSMGQRANPGLKAIYTGATEERLGGGNVLPREAQGTSTEGQVRYNEKRGGMPGLTPYGQEMLEIFGGAVPRLARLLRSKDTEGRHEGERMLGVPLFKVFPKQAHAEEKAKTARLWEQKLIDSRAAGNVTEYNRALDKLRQFGYDDARLERILTLSQTKEAELENLTREERRARALRKLQP